MNAVMLNPTTIAKYFGDTAEWAVCAYERVARAKHDSSDYRSNSDVNVGNRHISVKSSAFTLMSGNMCEGREDFDGIWNLYAENTHSNEFVYVAQDFTAYYMTIDEFEKFVYLFCRTERESEKNGGAMKIRCRKESKKMVEWLNAQVA